MNVILREKYPLLPIILYGHSMGSFFARWYAERYPDTIDGLIISGTAGPAVINGLGRALAGFIARTHKEGYVSKLLVKLSFGGYLKRIPDAKSASDWITHDRAIIEKYSKDPKCNFIFSAEDPVGNYGEGVKKVTKLLRDARIKDVTEYIDEKGRHELHNEVNKAEIMKKVVGWLDERFS